ncbi:MAG: methyltransferase domain-containing protein [Clostridiales bacterium]|nr:methyltransferase domain-containing protein [Clostridiales bacterium]
MKETVWQPLGGGIKVLTNSVHRFGTDALLLADFACPRPGERVCDLGTGCGVIPLYWFREGWQGRVTAVDIQPDAVELLNRSAAGNGLCEQIKAVCADLRRLPDQEIRGPFDLVTCNPPYFADGSGRRSRSDNRRTARHETECTLEDAANAAARLLRHGGRFCLCHRPERLCDCLDTMRRAGLEPKELRFCHHRAEKEPFLVLVTGKKGARPGLNVHAPLFVKGPSGEDSDEIKRIYGQI